MQILILTIFIGACFYELKRFILHVANETANKHLEAHQAELAEVAACLERHSLILVYRDATARGINPNTLGSTEELLRLMRGKKEQ